MPTVLTLSIKTTVNTNSVLTSADLKSRYLFGLNLTLPESSYDFFITAAKRDLERHLAIKLDLQVFKENRDFNLSDWTHWSQIKLTYPIVAPIKLNGFIGSVRQVDYPLDWLSVRKSDDDTVSRLLHVVPNAGSAYHQIAAIYTGFFPNAGSMGGGATTPEYWSVEYVTGFKNLPVDLENAVGMLASLSVLTVGNETLASAMGVLGTSSKSVSIDGLSQSISMYMNGSAGIFGARIKQYIDTLFGVNGNGGGLLDRLRDYYSAIIWTTA